MGEPDTKTRQKETTEMLDYAFANYETEILLSTKSNLGEKKVGKGKEKYVTIVPMEGVTLLHQKSEPKKNATYELNIDKIKAPVKPGEKVGYITIKEENNIIRKVPVTVAKEIKKANILELYLRYLEDVISGEIEFS